MIKRSLFSIAALLLLLGCETKTATVNEPVEAFEEVKKKETPDTEQFTYTAGDATLKGFIATPGKSDKYPGVLIIHEWWGHNDYVDKKARELADAGYVGYALDMFGDTASHPKDAGEMSKEAYQNFDRSKMRFEAALKDLMSRPYVDSTKIAVIGYCFGGGMAINMGLLYPEKIDLVSSFHGSLGSIKTPDAKTIDTKFLVHNGGADPFITQEQITALKGKMESLNAELDFYNYEGAKHGFTNKEADKNGEKFNIPLAYNQQADELSWKRTLEALEERFD